MLESFERVARSAREVVVLTHSNADVDAVAASCAIARALRELGSREVRVLVPEGIAVDARECSRLCVEKIGISIEVVRRSESIPNRGADLCVIVDTATMVQLKNLALLVDRCRACAIIDHHRERGKFRNVVLEYVDPSASSSSELVYELCKKLGVPVDQYTATMLIAGIIFDTRRFARATPRMFRVLAELMEIGGSYSEAMQLSAPKHGVGRGAKIARIKCILRHRGFHDKRSDLYIAVSQVGAYESQCANLLLSIGYDVAVVATEDDALKATRLVFRAKEDAVSKAALDVFNALLKPLVDKFGGGGGGHRVAGAAVVMRRSVDEVLRELGKVLREFFGDSLREIAEERVVV